MALEAALTAYKVELIAGLATRRPDALDRQLGQLGQPGAASPDWVATVLADTAGLLIDRLPATWAALAGWATTRSPRR